MVAGNDDFVQQVKDKSPIEEVIEGDGFPLPSRGRYRKCRTAHTGGLVVDVGKQMFFWNVQGYGGDVFTWTEKHHHVDFKGAVEILARRAGLPEPNWRGASVEERLAARRKEECLEVAARVFVRWLGKSAEARAYCEGRGWGDSSTNGANETNGEEEIKDNGKEDLTQSHEGAKEEQGEKEEDGEVDPVDTIQASRLGFSGEGSAAERNEMRYELEMGGVDLECPAAVAILGKRGGVVKWGQEWGVFGHDDWSDDWTVNDYIPGMIGMKRLVYPYLHYGRVVYLAGRSIDQKRHFNLPAALVGKKPVYVNQVHGVEAKDVVIVEGQADAVSLGQWGIAGISLGGVEPDEDLAELVKKNATCYIGLDADDAGEKNAYKVGDAVGPMARLAGWKTDRWKTFVNAKGETEEVKDANDLLKAMVQGGEPAKAQRTFVLGILKRAVTYIETKCAWAGGLNGAAKESGVKEAIMLAIRMGDYEKSHYRSRLAKLLGVGVRDYDHMLKTLAEVGKKSGSNMEGVPTMGGAIGGWLVEYLYDVGEHRAVLAWKSPDGKIETGRTVEIDGVLYEPYQPMEIFRQGGVLFPSQLGPSKSTKEVVAMIELFIGSVYLMPNRTDVKIMSYYALLSWLFDCFNTIPYLRAMGEAGAGKSELMRRIGLVCYRLMSANGAGSVSALFRMVELLGGTVFIDEADLAQSDTTADIVKFLNLGAMKNNPIWRTEEALDEAGRKTFVVRGFRTFCPKLIAARRDFRDDAVGSRCLTFKIQPRETSELVAAGVPLEVNEDIRMRALALRNILLRWRMEHWQPEIPIEVSFYDFDISSRLNQVTGPLMAVASDDPELQGEMRRFLRDYYAEMVLSRSMTVTARVIEAAWKIYQYPDLRKAMVKKDPQGFELLLVGDITRIANEIMDEMNGKEDEPEPEEGKKVFARARKDELSPHKIGRVIREELQLQVLSRTNKGYQVVWDQARMEALAKRYGIKWESIGPSSSSTNGANGTNGKKNEVMQEALV